MRGRLDYRIRPTLKGSLFCFPFKVEVIEFAVYRVRNPSTQGHGYFCPRFEQS